MAAIHLRNQRISDAKRYFVILNNPNFKFFSIKPISLEEEKDFLRKNPLKRKNNFEYNYAVMHGRDLVGAVGLRINQHVPYMAEMGYFIDESCWNRGFATQAVKKIEAIGFKELKLRRIEIVILPGNRASIKVASKCGYRKEGLLKKRILRNNNYEDAYLFAKTR